MILYLGLPAQGGRKGYLDSKSNFWLKYFLIKKSFLGAVGTYPDMTLNLGPAQEGGTLGFPGWPQWILLAPIQSDNITHKLSSAEMAELVVIFFTEIWFRSFLDVQDVGLTSMDPPTSHPVREPSGNNITHKLSSVEMVKLVIFLSQKSDWDLFFNNITHKLSSAEMAGLVVIFFPRKSDLDLFSF